MINNQIIGNQEANTDGMARLGSAQNPTEIRKISARIHDINNRVVALGNVAQETADRLLGGPQTGYPSVDDLSPGNGEIDILAGSIEITDQCISRLADEIYRLAKL